MKSREDRAIGQFVDRLSFIEELPVRIVERPDRENPGTGGCDAIVDRGGQRIALEHTTVDSFQEQRLDNARFSAVTRELEEAIANAAPDAWIEISLPTGTIPTGMDWSELGKRLGDEIVAALPSLEADYLPQEFQFDSVPFPVWIRRGLEFEGSGCVVMRQAPQNLHKRLADVMAERVRSKGVQLRHYRAQGYVAVLLLDSYDPYLVNHNQLARAFRNAAETIGGIEFDEVWLAETDREPVRYFPVKIGERMYPDLPEFGHYRNLQHMKR